jgi:hypothetical protein
MKRFVEGEDRRQGVLVPEFLDDYGADENSVWVIEVFFGRDRLFRVRRKFPRAGAGGVPSAHGFDLSSLHQ